MMIDSLCIFLKSGHTFTFKQVEILQNNETHIDFRYTAMSDGLEKIASFQKAQIAGWSIVEPNLPYDDLREKAGLKGKHRR